MLEKFTDRARKILALANQEALRFNHEYIGTEHLLLGLVKEGSGVGASVLKNLDVDLRKVRLEVEHLVKPGPETAAMGKLPQTPRARKALEYAIGEASNLNHNYVGSEHLLLGLLREHDGVAAQVLRNLGLELEEVREEVLNFLTASPTDWHKAMSPTAPHTRAEHRDDCELCRRLADVYSGRVENLIGGQDLTCALLADTQGSRGWCVVVLRKHVEHLDELPLAEQAGVFAEVARVAAAIRAVFAESGKGSGPPRINYECLGNLVAHVHWHVIPRHADDPEPTKPVWGWPEERLKGSMTPEERRDLVAKLREALAA